MDLNNHLYILNRQASRHHMFQILFELHHHKQMSTRLVLRYKTILFQYCIHCYTHLLRLYLSHRMSLLLLKLHLHKSMNRLMGRLGFQSCKNIQDLRLNIRGHILPYYGHHKFLQTSQIRPHILEHKWMVILYKYSLLQLSKVMYNHHQNLSFHHRKPQILKLIHLHKRMNKQKVPQYRKIQPQLSIHLSIHLQKLN